MTSRTVVITGIGLVSSLGVGNAPHQAALADPPSPALDTASFAPSPIHPLPEIDWSLQIPKRGDQRQMETWQRTGVFAAGLALDDAGLKGDEALCGTMDMIVAAGGGERDVAVDEAILEASLTRPDREILLNEKLTTDLRPTLFLAQLSNLMAGNISIVHKVTGSSRTFMGEEASGVSALAHAAARLRSGQSTHALVGGAYNAQHPDSLLVFAAGRHLHRDDWAPVWQRRGKAGGGLVAGSGGAFLVLETAEHAAARGARALARIGAIADDRLPRGDGHAAGIAALAARAGLAEGDLVLSGASGAHDATIAEREALAGGHALRAVASLIGHTREAAFPFAVALAALAVANGIAPPPFGDPAERPFAGTPRRALATTIGHHRGEGAVLVEAA